MFGIIYIVLSLLAGKELAEILLFTGKNAQEAGSRNGQHKAFCNQIWVLAAAAFGMGTLVFGWTTYMISWAASEAGAKKPLIYGNTAVLIITAVVLVLLQMCEHPGNRAFAGTRLTYNSKAFSPFQPKAYVIHCSHGLFS